VDVSTLEGCIDAARELRRRGFRRVLASLGAEGALLCGADGVLVADALDMDVVDTVGAGDALAAGYLAAIDDGESTETALRNGIAVASAVVERSGTSVPAFGDVASRRNSSNSAGTGPLRGLELRLVFFEKGSHVCQRRRHAGPNRSSPRRRSRRPRRWRVPSLRRGRAPDLR